MNDRVFTSFSRVHRGIHMISTSVKKYLLISLGSIALGLGIIGVFLPVLPTTPFLLLASFCYLRSSKRMYNWLIRHKIFGAYIYSYLTYKAIPKKVKIGTLIFLWSTLMISMLLSSSLHIRIFLIVVGTGVTLHLLTMKTLTLKDIQEIEDLYRSNQPE